MYHKQDTSSSIPYPDIYANVVPQGAGLTSSWDNEHQLLSIPMLMNQSNLLLVHPTFTEYMHSTVPKEL